MESEKTTTHRVVMRSGKTWQDRLPVNERPRVKEWERRLKKAQGKLDTSDDSE